MTWLSTLGVALGVLALVGGFSVTRGFERAFQEKILGLTAHVLVRDFGIRFEAHREVATRIEGVEGVLGTSPMTFSEAMISAKGGTTGVIIKGILPQRARRVLEVPEYMIEGDLLDLEGRREGLPGLIVGAELAEKINVKRGDILNLISPLKSPDPDEWNAGSATPSAQPFQVRGVFRAGFHEYDARLAYMALPEAQAFFGLGDNVLGIEVAVADPLRAEAAAEAIREALGMADFQVKAWQKQNKNLFASLMYQRVAILIVLSVMVLLAACNVAAMLIMLVLERRKEISILKAMGAKSGGILRLFILEGMSIGAMGTALGLVLAYGLFVGLLSSGIALDPSVYGIARLPIIFSPLDYLSAAIGATLITFGATILPALRAARQPPVEGIREALR
ncbi:ABC transporter permease [Myxococcota bacterium]|nr:ABC transporter permease [Myxococcota bacterium]MBU1431570.1 ABC transporter permease [Myxococcota bacterium]MBU1900497.1 ABC transporter permease [Myxococcota bacterium]